MADSKICQECKYFVKHFANYGGYYYLITGSGHCVNLNLCLSESAKRIKSNLTCEFWEPMQIQIEERRDFFKDTLRKMAECIDEIAMILKDDEKTLSE